MNKHVDTIHSDDFSGRCTDGRDHYTFRLGYASREV